MNFLMDRDAEHWARDIAGLKAQVGTCDTSAPIAPTGLLSGGFTWTCTHRPRPRVGAACAHARAPDPVAEPDARDALKP